jgi:hypothetical protein
VLNSHFWCFLVRAVEALATKVNPKAAARAKGAGKTKGGSSIVKAAAAKPAKAAAPAKGAGCQGWQQHRQNRSREAGKGAGKGRGSKGCREQAQARDQGGSGVVSGGGGDQPRAVRACAGAVFLCLSIFPCLFIAWRFAWWS